MMGSVSKVSKFFEYGKRQDKLLEVIKKELPKVKKKRVKPLCGTRWLDRFDSLKKIVNLYPAIVWALHGIAYGENSVSWNRVTVNDANGLLSAIEKFSFLLTLMVVFKVLHYIKGMTVLLQQRSLDIFRELNWFRMCRNSYVKELREEVSDWH